MNSAVTKYRKITSKYGDFKGSTTSIQEDIVSMMAKVSKTKARPVSKVSTTAETKRKSDDMEQDPPPPFLRHYKTSNQDDVTKYKLGDTKKDKD